MSLRVASNLIKSEKLWNHTSKEVMYWQGGEEKHCRVRKVAMEVSLKKLMQCGPRW